MSGYTPTTTEVRREYARISGPPYATGKQAQFSRWLRKLNAKVAAKAWDACLDAIDTHELNTSQAREGNPYRKTATEGK